jgi:hypothetical protein
MSFEPISETLRQMLVRQGLQKGSVGADGLRCDKEAGRRGSDSGPQLPIEGEQSDGIRLVWSQTTPIRRRTRGVRRPMLVVE